MNVQYEEVTEKYDDQEKEPEINRKAAVITFLKLGYKDSGTVGRRYRGRGIAF